MGNSILRRSVSNSLYSTAGNLACILLGLTFAGYRIRYLGVSQAGYIMLLETLTGIAAALGGLGLSNAGLRRIAVFNEDENQIAMRNTLSTVLAVNSMIGVLLCASLVLLFPWVFQWSGTTDQWRSDASVTTLLYGLSFLCTQIYASYEVTYAAVQRYGIIATVRSLFSFANSALGILLLMLYPTMITVASLSLALNSFRALLSIALTGQMLGSRCWPRFLRSEFIAMWEFGVWDYVDSLCRLLFMNFDKIVLTTILGSASLPFYVFGQRVVQQVHAFLGGQSEFLFPMLAGEYEKSTGILSRVADRLCWFEAFMAALFYAGLGLLARPLLERLVNVEFARLAYLPFVIACLQGFLFSLAIVPYHITLAMGKSRTNAIYVLVNGALFFAALLLLVPKLGILGASLAQLCCGISSVYLLWSVFKKPGNISWLSVLRPYLTPALSAVLWVGGMESVRIVFDLDRVGTVVAVLLIGPVATGLSLWFERKMFPEYRVLETIGAIGKVLFSKTRTFSGNNEIPDAEPRP